MQDKPSPMVTPGMYNIMYKHKFRLQRRSARERGLSTHKQSHRSAYRWIQCSRPVSCVWFGVSITLKKVFSRKGFDQIATNPMICRLFFYDLTPITLLYARPGCLVRCVGFSWCLRLEEASLCFDVCLCVLFCSADVSKT
jgi:hypothetical protein